MKATSAMIYPILQKKIREFKEWHSSILTDIDCATGDNFERWRQNAIKQLNEHFSEKTKEIAYLYKEMEEADE